jgi:hypothetical protein
MSLWEFAAAVGGYVKANSSDEGSITSAEADALAELIDRPPVWH